MLLYDIEIKKAIKDRRDPRIEGIEYCEGWDDFDNMGISTLCAYDYSEKRYRVFCDDNLEEAKRLFKERKTIIGFNSIKFDNSLVVRAFPDLTKEYLDEKSYDILQEIWVAAGLSRKFHYPSHMGYGLDAMIKANDLAAGKTGNGAMAPILYQQGKYAKVIDYCLADVWLTKMLFEKIMYGGVLIDPKTGDSLDMSIKPKEEK